MTATIMNLYDGYAQATEAVSNLERREFRIATSALSQTILIIGTLKIPPEGPRAVPLPSIVIATSRRSGRRSRHGCWNRRHGGVVGLRRRRPRTRASPVIELFSVPVYFGLI